jgi:hypothetical protein
VPAVVVAAINPSGAAFAFLHAKGFSFSGITYKNIPLANFAAACETDVNLRLLKDLAGEHLFQQSKKCKDTPLMVACKHLRAANVSYLLEDYSA